MRRFVGLLAASSCAALVLAFAPGASADSVGPITFEPPTYSLGSIDGQDGWLSAGSAGHGCAVYDHAVDSSLGTSGFGSQSLRMSNAVTSGCFSDQTFSKALVDPAGETGASYGGWSSGVRQTHFEAQWTFASTVPGAEQPGLSVVASPDRGDGSRMSWVQMADTPGGIDVNFFDVSSTGVPNSDVFNESNVATGLDRSVPHTIRITMDFVDGPGNDVVKVYVDGVLRHTGTSWEDYYRYDSEQAGNGNLVPIVNRILFRTGGTAAPLTAGKGFLIDNLSLLSSTPVGPPTSKDDCKKDGWQKFNTPRQFKNQGDCVSFVASGK